MTDDPRHHKGYLTLLALVALGTAPLPFIGSEPRFLLGIPLWLWWSFGMTVALSCLAAWGILRYWPSEEPEGDPDGTDRQEPTAP